MQSQQNIFPFMIYAGGNKETKQTQEVMLVCKFSPTAQRYLKSFTHDLDPTPSKYFSEKTIREFLQSKLTQTWTLFLPHSPLYFRNV